MATATFGNFIVDMTDPAFPAGLLGSDFDGQPVLASSSPTQLVFNFPTSAAIVFTGHFATDPLGRIFLSSPVDEIGLFRSNNALLVDITGLSGVTLASLTTLQGVGNVFDSQVTTVVTQGFDDIVVGDAGNEIAHTGGGHDIIRGNGGNDVLDGQAGADDMFGGTGNDTYFVDNAGDTVNELPGQGTDVVHTSISFTLPADVEQLVLDAGAGAIGGTGNALANVITGNGSPNHLVGGDGNDTLDGAGGADTMEGGAGDDTYVIDSAGDVVNEAADSGVDTERSAVDRVIDANVEELILTGPAAAGTGDARANGLTGNAGDNVPCSAETATTR